MRTDTEIRAEGFNALINVLGAVEAERFIALAHRESFDYTEWRQTQWPNETVASLADRARKLRENQASVREE
jgi:hypothetical protein